MEMIEKVKMVSAAVVNLLNDCKGKGIDVSEVVDLLNFYSVVDPEKYPTITNEDVNLFDSDNGLIPNKSGADVAKKIIEDENKRYRHFNTNYGGNVIDET